MSKLNKTTTGYTLSFEDDISGLLVDEDDLDIFTDAIVSRFDMGLSSGNSFLIFVRPPILIHEGMGADIVLCIPLETDFNDQISRARDEHCCHDALAVTFSIT